MTNAERDKILARDLKLIVDNMKSINELVDEIGEVCGIRFCDICTDGSGKREWARIQLHNGIEAVERALGKEAPEKKDWNYEKTMKYRKVNITQLAERYTGEYLTARGYEDGEEKGE